MGVMTFLKKRKIDDLSTDYRAQLTLYVEVNHDIVIEGNENFTMGFSLSLFLRRRLWQKLLFG